jgi:uncharacterized protein YbcC (UPF0753/DUF2309 family)
MSRQQHEPESLREALAHAVEHAAHLLPAQAPIARFVHHNTLHAYEPLPFDRAVAQAARELGGEPYLEERDYDDALARGRIAPADLDAALIERGVEDTKLGSGLPTRKSLRRLRLAAPMPDAVGEAVAWLVAETELLERTQPEVSHDARAALRLEGEERTVLRALWDRCLALAEASTTASVRVGPRLRDRVMAHTGQDADTLVNPFLVRFLAAYLDQGVAYWPMPDRDGLYAAFVRTYARAALVPPWLEGLREERIETRDALAQIEHELAIRGVDAAHVEPFVHAVLQALPGWAGMVRQLETRPDLAPGEVPSVSLIDYLAIRLVLDRLAARFVARDAGLDASALSKALSKAIATTARPDPRTFALELFVLAQRAGLGPKALASSRTAQAFVAEVRAFDALERRATFHLAYERAFRRRALDAIATRARSRIGDPAQPIAQLVMCIDEREESFRRHLEELDPRIATYGFAGNFGVLMSYVGHGAAHPVPLCPPVVTPKHRVREVPLEESSTSDHQGDAKRALGKARHERHVASRTLVRGGFVALTGVASAIPLVARTLFPGLADRLAHASRRALHGAPVPTRLALRRHEDEGPAEDGLFEGYTVGEQASVVEGMLRSIGLTSGFAELVVIAGHGSTSVNNPHASAYECGACAGSKGGPNARAFAVMANDPEVRRALALRGLRIPPSTVFVGTCHDTATDGFDWLDEDLVPAHVVPQLAELKAILERAGAHDARERCRRFPDAPLDMTPERALAHVQARAADLAQPRPEYCHATNALAVVGRRSLTRGLFLDRRAFLVSYDPTQDDAEGHVLERILAVVGPVGSGINLEYYFSRVDPDRYGSGTKLPHNVTGLLGVMNGHGSDLRTGLHWQTVELHEPMRLLLVVEATPDVLLAIAARNETVGRLVKNRWVLLASVHPETGDTWYLEPDGFVLHEPETELARVPSSAAHHRGRRDHLPFALVEARS